MLMEMCTEATGTGPRNQVGGATFGVDEGWWPVTEQTLGAAQPARPAHSDSIPTRLEEESDLPEATIPEATIPDALLSRHLAMLKKDLVIRFQVSPEQAADWVQSFVLEKVLAGGLFPEAHRRNGHGFKYLQRCLENFVVQKIRRESALKRLPAGGLVCLEALTEDEWPIDPDSGVELSDLLWARDVFGQCLEHVRTYCAAMDKVEVWGVFEGRLLRPLVAGDEPVPYEQLVRQLNLESTKQAANLLVTAQRIFSRCLQTTMRKQAKCPTPVEGEVQDLKAVLFTAANHGLLGPALAISSGEPEVAFACPCRGC